MKSTTQLARGEEKIAPGDLLVEKPKPDTKSSFKKKPVEWLSWVQVLGSLIISWPMVLIIFLLLFKNSIITVIDTFTKTPGSKAEIGSFKFELGPTVIPPQYRLTTKDDENEQIDLATTIGEIRDTGPEGTTVGFAVAYALQAAYKIEKGEDLVFSARSIYTVAQQFDEWPGENYEGTTIKGALEGLVERGAYLEKDWPYSIKNKPSNQNASLFKISRYKALRGVEDILNVLRNKKVVMATISVTRDFDQPDSGRVTIKLPVNAQGSKAIAITGYRSGNAEFSFANDWGVGWGQNGFGTIKDTDLAKILSEAYILEL